MTRPTLTAEFVIRLTESARTLQPFGTNTDLQRFPPASGVIPKAKRTARRLADTAVARYLRRSDEPVDRLTQRVDALVTDWAGFEDTYATLGDDSSRDVMAELLVHKVLGARHHRLSTNNELYRSGLAAVDAMTTSRGELALETGDWVLDRLDLTSLDVPASLLCSPMNVMNTFALGQYRYDVGGVTIEVEPGDVVIDCGACWGDTTLYFAHRAGPEGRVMAIEFVPSNIRVLEMNRASNREVMERVVVVPHPVWDTSGETIYFDDRGPATRFVDDPAFPATETRTIDDIVEEQQLSRVDFIKMDIEGAEIPALRGAERTISAHRPKLAISAYHRSDDLVTIPKFLHDHGYRCYLAHFTIHNEETMLFGQPL